jgi:hypothetical protein
VLSTPVGWKNTHPATSTSSAPSTSSARLIASWLRGTSVAGAGQQAVAWPVSRAAKKSASKKAHGEPRSSRNESLCCLHKRRLHARKRIVLGRKKRKLHAVFACDSVSLGSARCSAKKARPKRRTGSRAAAETSRSAQKTTARAQADRSRPQKKETSRGLRVCFHARDDSDQSAQKSASKWPNIT